jgi:hypothetical protein
LTQIHEPTAWLDAKAAALRAELGTSAFDEHWTRGKALSMAEAINLAQQQLEALSPS